MEVEMESIMSLLDIMGIAYIQKGEELFAETEACCGGSRQSQWKLQWCKGTKRFFCHRCSELLEMYDLCKEHNTLSSYFKEFPKKDEVANTSFKIDISCSYLSMQNRLNKIQEFDEEKSNYDKSILEQFSEDEIFEWTCENISYETQQHFGVKFDRIKNRAIIPQYNIDGDLICIRCRNFNLENNAPKYIPLWLEGASLVNKGHKGYMYGEYVHRERLKNEQVDTVILVESEKAVQMYYEYYGDSVVVLALTGSSIKHTQVEQLMRYGVKNIVLALDRDYNNREEELEYIAKLKKGILKRLRLYFNIQLKWDRKYLLPYKGSPCDLGKEILEQIPLVSESELK